MYDVIIVGAGPAGASAAIFAKKAGLKTILVEGPKLKDYKMNIKPTFKVKSLKSAVNLILRKN